MKRMLLFSASLLISAGLLCQYQGVPWKGTAWTFGTDNAANFSVGKDYSHKKGAYNGIPHFLYDIGVVDTLKRAGDDPTGLLVAGQGTGYTGSLGKDMRTEAATTDSKTLDPSDIAALTSPTVAGVFQTHENRAVFNRSGVWCRYTCSFTEGNYRIVLRSWGNSFTEQAFWFRVYDKATMNPLYPWTRYHPGSGEGDATLQEGLSYVDVSQDPYTGYAISTLPAKTNWMAFNDLYSLSGEVVIEYCDPGPTPKYGENVAQGGSLGEIAFEYVGPVEDKFAPVAEIWKDIYDDMDTILLTLSENGTLYLVPNGTATDDLETAKIDKKEMTTLDGYMSIVKDMTLNDTIQIVTKDAADNIRYTAPIEIRNVIIPDTLKGNNGDTISVSLTRKGILVLIPEGTTPDMTSIIAAFNAGQADTAFVEAGRDTLILNQVSGDGDYELYLVEIPSGNVSLPVAFQVGAGSPDGISNYNQALDVNVYFANNQIIIYNAGGFDQVYIYSILGKQIMHERITSTRMEFDASGFGNGIYILKMQGSKTGVVSKKFLINTK
jgi:hypothetical protein